MGMENIDILEGSSKSVTGRGSQVGEGKANSGEVKERAGKATLSGRVPLMPAHLADAGYQGEKKGVRARKVTLTKNQGRRATLQSPRQKVRRRKGSGEWFSLLKLVSRPLRSNHFSSTHT